MIKILDNFLTDTTPIDELYQYFHYAGQWQFDFMPAKYVNKKTQNSKTETHICNIIKEICKTNPKFAGAGYEVWVNLLDEHNDHLDQHVDRDEGLDNIYPAKMTATLYLGTEEDLEGGDLAIHTVDYNANTHFYSDIYELEKATNENIDNTWIKIPYRYNRLLFFDSQFPHAVLPIKKIKSGESRITLTISSWDKKITVVR